MEKTDHTEDSARFVAKDMVGGIDVELEVHRCEQRGIRLGASTAREESTKLDLWSIPSPNESTSRTKPQRRFRRAFKRITSLLKIAS